MRGLAETVRVHLEAVRVIVKTRRGLIQAERGLLEACETVYRSWEGAFQAVGVYFFVHESQNAWQIEMENRLPVSAIRGVVDSAHRRYGESSTPRIGDTGSRRLRVSAIRGVDFPFLFAMRSGLYLGHPWTDFSHFFNFEDPFSIFCKFYFTNIFLLSL